MLERIFIAGSGGQGVLTTGKLLASVAVRHVEHLTFFPSYGAEVRGGTSNCQVVFSSREIASPVSERFDTLIVMNQESADAFLSRQAPGALVLLDSSLCSVDPQENIIMLEALRMADELGNARVANVILLGAYLSQRSWIPPQAMESGIVELLSHKGERVIDLNLRALRTGLEAGAAHQHPAG